MKATRCPEDYCAAAMELKEVGVPCPRCHAHAKSTIAEDWMVLDTGYHFASPSDAESQARLLSERYECRAFVVDIAEGGRKPWVVVMWVPCILRTINRVLGMDWDFVNSQEHYIGPLIVLRTGLAFDEAVDHVRESREHFKSQVTLDIKDNPYWSVVRGLTGLEALDIRDAAREEANEQHIERDYFYRPDDGEIET